MQRHYKILLSAYACEPNKGSEPGVGWHWAIELAKIGHKVFVITRTNNKESIKEYLNKNIDIKNIEFIYYDLPKCILWLKKKGLSVNIYYLLWQIFIVPLVKKKHKEINFDLIHHITFGVFRHPSFLYKINTPLIFGPVGGGEYTPKSLKFSFSSKYLLKEYLRSTINYISVYNPFLLKLYKKSLIILTKTEETKYFISSRFGYKTINCLEIGISSVNDYSNQSHNDMFRVLYVGRLVYWKGFDIAIKAFKLFLENNNNAEFLIIGSGSYKNKIIALSEKYNIRNNIKIIDWLPQEELKKYYSNCDVLLFPSLHDSSGNVVLEALSFGLPVICLDCGGPAIVLGKTLNKLIINTNNTTFKNITNEIANKLHWLSSDNVALLDLKKRSIERANELTWSIVVSSSYNMIHNIIQKNVSK